MGLTKNSTGLGAAGGDVALVKGSPDQRTAALAGNPNVGKSTVFNALTKMRQHTGNWPGKTVSTAQGRCRRQGRDYVLVDLPGCYSLLSHSAEEEAARDFLCFGGADCAVVVCDASCLERNLNLTLQVLELKPNALLCVNLLDEARRKGVAVDLPQLSRLAGSAAGEAQAELGRLCALLERRVPAERLRLDFSIVNDMRYYNGVIFRGCLPGLASGVLAGGRYDNLLRRMGKTGGAVGFAVYLDQLERLEEEDGYDVDVLLLYSPGDDPAAVSRLAGELREEGRSVRLGRSAPPGLRCRETLRFGEGGGRSWTC